MDPRAVIAILGMGVATYLTRIAGFYLLRGVTVRGRLKAALDALPPAILMAVIAPMVVTTGVAESLAAAITAVTAYRRVPLAVVIVVGVVSVVVLRHVIP